MAATAKVFRHRYGQVVELPQAYWFATAEVRIHREGNRVVLEPLRGDDWGEAFWDVFGAFGDDFHARDGER